MGLQLVRSVLSEKDWPLFLSSIKSCLFGNSLTAVNWVEEYRVKYGSWPSESQVEDNLGFKFSAPVEPVEYLCDLLRKRELKRRGKEEMVRAIKLLEANKPEDAFSVLQNLSMKSADLLELTRVMSFRESGPERYEAYEKVKMLGGYSGVDTPWPTINSEIQGYVNGSLNVIVAMTNTGKSWLSLICADHALRQGKKVMMVTLEMSSTAMARRFDSINYHIPFGDLRDARLNLWDEKRWRDGIKDNLVGDGDFQIADKNQVRTVTDAYNLVRIHQPDIIFVDGGYRFESETHSSNSSKWANSANIVESLQRVSEKSEIPWVVTTQLGDSNEKGGEKKAGEPITTWGVRYAKEWSINPDIVIGLSQNSAQRLAGIMEVHKVKVRDHTSKSSEAITEIHWDHENNNYSEIDKSGGGIPLASLGRSIAF